MHAPRSASLFPPISSATAQIFPNLYHHGVHGYPPCTRKINKEREREREKDRERERKTERDRKTEREGKTEREEFPCTRDD